MSGSAGTSSVFVTDAPKVIKEKINKYAFSGGQVSQEDQRRLGADLTKDVSYEYLRYLLEDDKELADIGEKYGSGKMLTGEVKQRLITELQMIIERHQKARAKVTDDTVRHFMNPH